MGKCLGKKYGVPSSQGRRIRKERTCWLTQYEWHTQKLSGKLRVIGECMDNAKNTRNCEQIDEYSLSD